MHLFKIESWNIKVLNGPPKHKAIKTLIKSHNLTLVAVLETKITSNHIGV